MKKLFQIVLVSSLSLLCFSCYYDEIPEHILNGQEIPEIPDTQVVSFSTDIQPIFTNNCINCHNQNVNPDLRVGKSLSALIPTYVVASNANESALFNYLPGNGHHAVGSTLSVDEIALIKAWINQGALNN